MARLYFMLLVEWLVVCSLTAEGKEVKCINLKGT